MNVNLHDQKQYQLMNSYLESFENNQLKIDKLISVLDALLESLKNPDLKWKDKFRSEWWSLEQVYAVSLDRNESTLLVEMNDLINETIKSMKTLLSNFGDP